MEGDAHRALWPGLGLLGALLALALVGHVMAAERTGYTLTEAETVAFTTCVDCARTEGPEVAAFLATVAAAATGLPATPEAVGHPADLRMPVWLPRRCGEFVPLFVREADRRGLEPALLAIVSIVESGCQRAPRGELGSADGGLHYSQFARGSAGWMDAVAKAQGQSCRPNTSTAYGLMQITTQWHGMHKDWCDPEQAVPHAAGMLAGGLAARGSLEASVYAYNSGNTPTAEGRRYTRWVMGMYEERTAPTSAYFEEWCRVHLGEGGRGTFGLACGG